LADENSLGEVGETLRALPALMSKSSKHIDKSAFTQENTPSFSEPTQVRDYKNLKHLESSRLILF